MEIIHGGMTVKVHSALAALEPVADFRSFETSSGPVKVPLLLRETVGTGAFFSVPIGKIRKFLPSSKLKPVTVGRGRTIYAIGAYEYLDTSIGPYSEVAMGVPCIYDPHINLPFLPAIFDQAYSVVFYLFHLLSNHKNSTRFWSRNLGLPKIPRNSKV